MTSYRVIGLMSGTSLDGIDLADVHFEFSKSGWKHKIINTKSKSYPKGFQKELATIVDQSADDIAKMNLKLGHIFASFVHGYLSEENIKPEKIDAVASHGHTVFHQPERGFTLQIGDGRVMAKQIGIDVINDLRSKDVEAGGQGAPLVPIGDKLLFNEIAGSFLNIGGIANISMPGNSTKAFDICTGNLPLNAITRKHFDREYDKGGEIARGGKRIEHLFHALNELSYFHLSGPKSMGIEWINENMNPLLSEGEPPENILRTLVEHSAYQIAKTLEELSASSVCITGGGALNDFLIEQIDALFSGDIVIPDTQLIEFKEAIIFSFLGALFLDDKPNCLSSVTGAKHDVKGGLLHEASLSK